MIQFARMQMSIRTNLLPLIYGKTPQGQEAIATRSVPLLAVERRVLILIDGERSVAELYRQLNHQDVVGLIGALEGKGLIALVRGEYARLPLAKPAVSRPSVPAVASLPAEDLLAVKSLMIRSSQQGLGLLAARLVREIEEINDAPTLKATMARWNMALRESRSVAAQADQLLQTAKALLPAYA
jgi:hypothetical protein